MYYPNNSVTEIEELVMDFLEYRKTKKVSEYTDPLIGKGWPHYRGLSLMELSPEPVEQIEVAEVNEQAYDIPDNDMPDYEMPVCGILPPPLNDSLTEKEQEQFRHLYSEILRKLEPFVTMVVSKLSYDGSPIHDNYLDSESIAQIADRVIELAKNSVTELNSIYREVPTDGWSRISLLCAVVESMVLSEIYIMRKRVNY